MADLELIVNNRYVACAGRPSHHTVVRAARAIGICDCVVSTSNSTEFGDSARFFQGREVSAGEISVTLHHGVADVAVERRSHLDRAGPILGDDGRLHRGNVRLVHRDESMLGHRRGAACVVTEAQLPRQDGATNVENLTVGKQPDLVDVEPIAAVDAECQRKPVGKVHKTFVIGCGAGYLVLEAVEHTGGIGARVVDLTGLAFRCSTASGEVAVSNCAQGLT